MKKFLVVMICVFVLTMGVFAGKEKEKKAVPCEHHAIKCKHQPIVEELITILEVRPDLKKALLKSLKEANRLDAPTLKEYYKFLDNMVTLIPTERNLYYHIVEFYYLLDPKDDSILQHDPLFQQWMIKFADDWGSFLDTPASAKGIQTFLTDPDFHMDDYYVPPSGWLTFNQFFARKVKGGKRPVDHPCDDNVIVSPADSTFRAQFKIKEDSTIVVKGIKYSVMELLDGSPYQECFKGGTFMHSFLNVNDYHRYHVPVRGKVLEARQIYGNVFLETEQLPDGSLHARDETGYQFKQARGLVVLDSPIGLVAVLPIGMAQVSSCNINVEVGAELAKGEEFGYFLFGGSDIIVMFDRNCKVKICMKEDVHYNQGKTIAAAGNTPCPPPPPEPECWSPDKKQK